MIGSASGGGPNEEERFRSRYGIAAVAPMAAGLATTAAAARAGVT
jgi:hypothetical protein